MTTDAAAAILQEPGYSLVNGMAKAVIYLIKILLRVVLN